MQYYFVNKDTNGTERDSILFAKIDQIFTLNFETDEVTTIYKYETKFQMQPMFFRANNFQDILVVAS